MSDHEDRQKKIEDLMSQDPDINDTKMRAFRMKLQENLADWEHRGARVWRVLWIAVFAYLFEMVFAFAYLNRVPGEIQRPYQLPFMISLWITFVVGIWAIVRYVGKYAPTIRRLRYDVQNAMIVELQQQVVALREEIRGRQSPPPNDSRS